MELSITRGLWVVEWGGGQRLRKKENSKTFSTLNGIISIKKTNDSYHKTQALTAESCPCCLCVSIWCKLQTLGPWSLNLCSHDRMMTSITVMSRLCTNAHTHFGLYLLSQRACMVSFFQCASGFRASKKNTADPYNCVREEHITILAL